MTTYYVDDGGDNSNGSSWATAYTSVNALDAAVALASGDIVYFGHDSQCQAVNAANLTITGPASGAPVKFISVTQGTTTYQKGTGNQIDTSEGAFNVIFDGSFALYGIRVNCGSVIDFNHDTDESLYASDCDFALGANAYLRPTLNAPAIIENCVLDLTADATTPRTNHVFSVTYPISISGVTFVNAGYRTGTVFDNGGADDSTRPAIRAADFSGFTNATTCEILAAATRRASFSNCKTAATWTPVTGTTTTRYVEALFQNCGSGDQPVQLYYNNYSGTIVSSSSIYRTGGATIEGIACSWLITTNATVVVIGREFLTPWIYGRIPSTGSKTFDVYITNDTADFNNDEVWLEVEYKADASSGEWTLITDKPATITTAAAAQTDDSSTWNGTGPSFTYKQKLSVTATVNTTGLFRARVCVGVASILASRYMYVDPKIFVT